MKKIVLSAVLYLIYTSGMAQSGRITESHIETFKKEGLDYYKQKKDNTKKKRHLNHGMVTDASKIAYDGKHVQLVMCPLTTRDKVPNAGHNGMVIETQFFMLFAKRLNEDTLTYIGYYPGKKDQISVTPFKKHAAIYLSDYPELAAKVANKAKGYKRYDAIAVFQEYDSWLGE